MDSISLAEVTTVLASICGCNSDEVTGWVITVEIKDKDGNTGILCASPANTAGIPESEGRMANISALASSLARLTQGFFTQTFPDYYKHVEEIPGPSVCLPCNTGMHSLCLHLDCKCELCLSDS
jgi:hypothetical protein